MPPQETPTATEGQATSDTEAEVKETKETKETKEIVSETTDEKDEGAGSKRAILADLAKERDARQALEKELTTAREAQMTEQERAIAQARSEARAEALTTANQRIVRAEIKSAAVGKLRNPDIAVRLISFDKFSVDDEGDVDGPAIERAIGELLDEYPELAPSKGPGTADGGVRQTPAPEVQPGLGRLQYAYSQKDQPKR